jgi:flagellar protein FlbD
MIALTRLNDKRFVLNAEQIRYIESTPDTLITLIGGDKVMVKETLEEVVKRAVEYTRHVRLFQV